VGDDVVARPFEVVVDTLIEPVVRRLAQVTRFEKFDELNTEAAVTLEPEGQDSASAGRL
jgi:hypothetical protein